MHNGSVVIAETRVKSKLCKQHSVMGKTVRGEERAEGHVGT